MSIDYDALEQMYNSAGALQSKQIKNEYKLGKEEIKARLKIAAQSSKDARYGIDAERETAREQIEQARQEMLRIGIPQMEINRFVAEANKELATQELALKREIFLAESGLARDQLQLDREEMERIGIPEMEIKRYIAEKEAGIREQEMALEERKFGQGQYEFNTQASGYMGGPGGGGPSAPPLAPQQQQRMQELADRQAVGGQLAPAEQQELGALQAQQTASMGGGGGGRQNTLSRDQFEQEQLEQARRYGLDVAQFGAELASTPDTYFQGRRFQGVDVPRLMGGAGAQTGEPMGGPTPGVATMGAYLGGQDPYGQQQGAPPTGLQGPGTGVPYGGGPTPGGGFVNDGGGGQMMYPGGGGAFNEGGGQRLQIDDPGFQSGAAVKREALVGHGMPMNVSQDMATPYGGAMARPAPTSSPTPAPGAPPDPRLRQVAQIAKASPPSPFDGLDQQDTATLKLMQSIYQKGGQSIAGGEYERLKASGRLGFMQSAGRLLGHDPKELESQYQAYRPSQGSASAY